MHHVSGLEVGHAAARVVSEPDLILLGDKLSAPGAEILQQRALAHELRHQEDLAPVPVAAALLNDQPQ